MVGKGLFDWLSTVKLDDFPRASVTSKDLSCMLTQKRVCIFTVIFILVGSPIMQLAGADPGDSLDLKRYLSFQDFIFILTYSFIQKFYFLFLSHGEKPSCMDLC